VHDAPAVGRHLQDHLSVLVIATIRGSNSRLAADKPLQLARYLLARRGMLTSNVGEAMAFTRSAADLPAPDLQFIFAPVEFIEHALAPPPGHGITCGTVLLQPASEGAITLMSADPFAAPRIEPRYLSDPNGDDLRVLIAGVRLAREILRAPALASAVDAELWPGDTARTDDELGEFVRQRAETIYHPVGTCRMGPDPGSSVVDPPAGARYRRPSSHRRVGHADDRPRQHQRADDHDRGTSGSAPRAIGPIHSGLSLGAGNPGRLRRLKRSG
jgi:choline dehydrogenase